MATTGAQPGNNNAGKTRPFWRSIERACAQEDGKRLRAAAEKLLDLAAEGVPWAVRELADRMDGKSIQAISGPDGGPLQIERIEVVIVDPKG